MTFPPMANPEHLVHLLFQQSNLWPGAVRPSSCTAVCSISVILRTKKQGRDNGFAPVPINLLLNRLLNLFVDLFDGISCDGCSFQKRGHTLWKCSTAGTVDRWPD